MPQLTIQQAFDLAIKHHQNGQLQQAEALYRRVLEQQPNNADALNNLGLIAFDAGQQESAVELVKRAIAVNPTVASYHSNLGYFFQALKRREEALDCHQRAVALDQNEARFHNNLGNALRENGRINEALASYQRALTLNPNFIFALNNIAIILIELGRSNDALKSIQKSLILKPDFFESHVIMGDALMAQKRFTEAMLSYQNALRLDPKNAMILNNLGNVYKDLGRTDEAIGYYEKSIEIDPKNAIPQNNLGNALKDQGRMEEAVARYDKATRLDPTQKAAWANKLFTLSLLPCIDNSSIAVELKKWNQKFAEPLRPFILEHANDRNPDRKLRIGYVSPDFYMHSVGGFLLPLIQHHDRSKFELFAYAEVAAPDIYTERFCSLIPGWRSTIGIPDEQVANQIRADRIDILVDLAMHTAGNRLLVFAHKPAPVQVTWLAYCGSTGLATMDYRLSDPFLDPPGMDESVYCEQTIRLPETFWCYSPTGLEAPVNALPAKEKGHVTFGSLNNPCKLSEQTLVTWGHILQHVPQSQLVIHAPEGSSRQRVMQKMAEMQIDAQRIKCFERVQLQQYFQLYHEIDIALDPFPYGGGTTTCDALWMGVPVVSLAGKTGVGRGGLSILSNIGLPELVANSVEEYVQIAANLANDLPRLAEFRATLRGRMQASPLMDAPRFALNIEAAYRAMWRKWCAESRPGDGAHAGNPMINA